MEAAQKKYDFGLVGLKWAHKTKLDRERTGTGKTPLADAYDLANLEFCLIIADSLKIDWKY